MGWRVVFEGNKGRSFRPRRDKCDLRKTGQSNEAFPREGAGWTEGTEGIRDPGGVWSGALKQRLWHRSPGT